MACVVMDLIAYAVSLLCLKSFSTDTLKDSKDIGCSLESLYKMSAERNLLVPVQITSAHLIILFSSST